MINKTKTALIVAFILGSASAAFAQASGEGLRHSQLNQQQNKYTQLHEGRNVYEGPYAGERMRAVPLDGVYAQSNPYAYRNPANRSPIESFGGY